MTSIGIGLNGRKRWRETEWSCKGIDFAFCALTSCRKALFVLRPFRFRVFTCKMTVHHFIYFTLICVLFRCIPTESNILHILCMEKDNKKQHNSRLNFGRTNSECAVFILGRQYLHISLIFCNKILYFYIKTVKKVIFYNNCLFYIQTTSHKLKLM